MRREQRWWLMDKWRQTSVRTEWGEHGNDRGGNDAHHPPSPQRGPEHWTERRQNPTPLPKQLGSPHAPVVENGNLLVFIKTFNVGNPWQTCWIKGLFFILPISLFQTHIPFLPFSLKHTQAQARTLTHTPTHASTHTPFCEQMDMT